jgi:hypothetical protein
MLIMIAYKEMEQFVCETVNNSFVIQVLVKMCTIDVKRCV